MKPLRRGARAAEGLLLLATIGIEAGGNYVLALTRGQEQATEFQTTFARSGHGHAGSLATLGAVTVILAEQTELKGPALQVARWAVPVRQDSGGRSEGHAPAVRRPVRPHHG